MRRFLLPAVAGAALFGFGFPTLTASAMPAAPSAVEAPTGGVEKAQLTPRQRMRVRSMRNRMAMRNRMMMRRDMRRRMMMRRRMR